MGGRERERESLRALILPSAYFYRDTSFALITGCKVKPAQLRRYPGKTLRSAHFSDGPVERQSGARDRSLGRDRSGSRARSRSAGHEGGRVRAQRR